MYNNILALNSDPISQLTALIGSLQQQINQLSKEVKSIKSNESHPSQNSEKSEYKEIDFVKTSDLILDPSRFQYKIFHDAKTGSSGSLSDITTFNLDLCGMLSVWLDPTNNKIYVINGHNRKWLADRLKVDKLPCRFIKAKTAKDARIIGALQNISENSGSVLDAAKFFKETNKTLDELKKLGLTLKGKVSKDAIAISKLTNFLFEKYLLGELPEDKAIILGYYSEERQKEIYSLSGNFNLLSLEKFEELAKMVDASACAYQVDLFGNLDIDTEKIKKKLSLINAVSNELKRESRLFNSVAKNANNLKKANNEIDQLTSSNISDIAFKAYELLNQFKYVSGKIADLVDESLEYPPKSATRYLKEHLLELASDFNPSLLDHQESKPKQVQIDPKEKILSVLSETPKNLDIIILDCGLPTHEVTANLLLLEFEDLVKQLPGNNFLKR